MGELQHAIDRSSRSGDARAVALAIALLAAIAAACSPAPTDPSPSTSAPVSTGSGGPRPTTSVPVSPETPAVDPATGRLVWLVDRAGELGVWTTDLAGGDVRPYLSGLDEDGTTIRDAQLVGEDVVLIRERPEPGGGGGELWVVSRSLPPRLVMSGVTSFVPRSAAEVVAVVDLRTVRTLWRVPLDGTAATSIARLQIPDQGPQLGPFGLAISPDGRFVAVGWVGGPLEIMGPTPVSLSDIGAPLVVDDDGRLLAVTGRAGEAYRLEGNRLVELAQADSDPLVMPGTGTVAWPSVGEDGQLIAVEVRDLFTGTSVTYPASGLATNVRALTPDHVILEATAFDPFTRTVTIVDRRDGRSATFEASAPGD